MASKEDREKAAQAAWAAFFRHIEKTYGVSKAFYLAMYKAQGGRCYICRKSAGKTRRLAIDHNHLTGEVRGLLCSGSRDPKTCNRLIAFYTREALLRAAEYMTNPPARAVLAAMEEEAGK